MLRARRDIEEAESAQGLETPGITHATLLLRLTVE